MGGEWLLGAPAQVPSPRPPVLGPRRHSVCVIDCHPVRWPGELPPLLSSAQPRRSHPEVGAEVFAVGLGVSRPRSPVHRVFPGVVESMPDGESAQVPAGHLRGSQHPCLMARNCLWPSTRECNCHLCHQGWEHSKPASSRDHGKNRCVHAGRGDLTGSPHYYPQSSG